MIEYLTTKQASKALGISQRRVQKLIQDKRLPAKRFGNAWLINFQDLSLVTYRTPGRPRKGM